MSIDELIDDATATMAGRLLEANRDTGDESTHEVFQAQVRRGLVDAPSLTIPVETSCAALANATEAQAQALWALVQDCEGSKGVNRIVVHIGTWAGLPESWLAFRIDLFRGKQLFGGINPDGSVST